MNSRWLALGLIAACLGTAHGQDKMPVPVEDDPNAPPELRGQPKSAPVAAPAPAQAAPPPETRVSGSPYSQAMALYKDGEYDRAFDAIKGVDPAAQDDNFVVLESRILTELKRYDDGEKLLKERLKEESDSAAPNAAQIEDLELALGDLYLHRRNYDRAAKEYETALQAKPGDPDVKLKLIYAHIGSNDLRAAEKLASELSPFDPKNPYDDHASYYFAHAALAQAQGRAEDADEDIQNARTNYGITVTNRYLKAYLEFFAAANTSPASVLTPPKP